MSGPGDGFVDVGRARDLRPGTGRVYELDGTPVAVFRTTDGWAAIGDTCPHMGTSLASGQVKDGVVECPWHHWRFELGTGRSTARDWACVPVYEVAVDSGRVWLKPPPAPPRNETSEDAAEDDSWMRADPETFFKKPRS